MPISANVDGDNRGQRIIRAKEDGSISAPGEDGDHQRPDGQNDSKCYENSIVCDEARTDEIHRRCLAKLELVAELFPAIHRFLAEEFRHTNLFSRPPGGGIK